MSHLPTYPRRHRAWPWVLAAVVALGLLSCAGVAAIGSVAGEPAAVESFQPTLAPEPAATKAAPTTTAPAAKPTPAKTTKAPPPPPPVIEDGTWTVGDDVPPGVYKVNARIDSGAMCYWAITKTGSNGGDIIANDLPSGGRPSVVLKKGQDFETERCGTWTRVK